MVANGIDLPGMYVLDERNRVFEKGNERHEGRRVMDYEIDNIDLITDFRNLLSKIYSNISRFASNGNHPILFHE